MQDRSTTDSRDGDLRDGDSEERAPFGERLMRNQRGILLAVALTLAAAGVLLVRLQG